MDCSVCCEKINLSTRKDICCVFCDYIVCRTCFQKYITETPIEPHCMNCKKTFDFGFITNNCTSVFVTKNLKIHRENILFDREKSLLPETQPHVVLEIQKRNLKKQINLIEEQKFELRRQERVLNNRILLLNSDIHHLNNFTVESSEDRKKFIRKCPMNECRGFLSTQWKCGSCERKICNKCNEEKNEDQEHRCIPENVASMELLNKDTKPCPNCGTMIFKISGCSQMFCVDCHTAWDWNTHRIVTGVVHNPHYYEFINRNGGGGRNHGDIPCGGLPDSRDIRNMLVHCYPTTPSPFLLNIHQCITHIQHYELRNHNIQNVIEINRGLRVKYLINELSEIEFKTTLQQSEKKRQKTIAFHNIYQMFIDVSSDIFRQMIVFYNKNHKNSNSICINFIDENILIITNLIEYFNENLKKIGKMYKCVYPGISKNTHWANNIETANRQPSV